MIFGQYMVVWYLINTWWYDIWSIHGGMILDQYMVVWYLINTWWYDTSNKHLARFYTDRFSYGLHKGGRKSKTDPNNYQAITLSSSILKLFEILLLCLLLVSKVDFRPIIGFNRTSFMSREYKKLSWAWEWNIKIHPDDHRLASRGLPANQGM